MDYYYHIYVPYTCYLFSCSLSQHYQLYNITIWTKQQRYNPSDHCTKMVFTVRAAHVSGCTPTLVESLPVWVAVEEWRRLADCIHFRRQCRLFGSLPPRAMCNCILPWPKLLLGLVLEPLFHRLTDTDSCMIRPDRCSVPVQPLPLPDRKLRTPTVVVQHITLPRWE